MEQAEMGGLGCEIVQKRMMQYVPLGYLIDWLSDFSYLAVSLLLC